MTFDYANFYDYLVEQAPERSTIVEVGCFEGESLTYLARKAYQKNIQAVGVDWGRGLPDFNGGLWTFSRPTANILVENMHRTGLPAGVPIIMWDSAYAARFFQEKSVFAVFIDADHNEEFVRRDVLAWMGKIQAGGILAGHDYDWPSVKAGVEPILGKCQSVINPRVWVKKRTLLGWRSA